LKKKRDDGKLDNVQTHKELYTEADRLDILQKAPLILVEVLFSANIIQEIRKHRNLLLRFTHNNLKAQRYLIGGLEQIIALHTAKLLEKTAGILKLFYDSDILEEKAILEWAAKVSKKYVSKEVAAEIHEKAKPFVQWLQEAEEEESSEEESDVEIEYDDRAKIDGGLRKEVVKKEVKKPQDDDGDEIDIDDI
jgi:translation initiation factor 5